jgi:ribosomal-protein-alanine N-acetyltransferase
MYINTLCLPENYSEFFYVDLHEKYPNTFIVSIVEDNIVGYIMCRMETGFSELGKWNFTKKGHVVSIAVLPEYRKRGIGTSLMCQAMKEMRNYGMKECYLEVRVSNQIAKKLYRKIGFKEVKTIQGYYRDREAANVMAVNLDI